MSFPATYRNAIYLILGIALMLGLTSLGISRQAPVGSLVGMVTMTENDRPLPKAYVYLRSTADYGDPNFVSFTRRTNDAGEFQFIGIPPGEYWLNVSGRAHTAEDQRVTVIEGERESVSLGAKPVDPYLNVYPARSAVYPGDEAKVRFDGFLPDDSLQVTVYNVNPLALIKTPDISQASWTWQGQRKQAPDAGPAFQGDPVILDVSVENRDGEGVFSFTTDLGRLTEGVYYVEARAKGQMAGAAFTVTRLGLIAKADSRNVMGYVADLKTGEPVGQAYVTFYPSNGSSIVGATDQDGLVQYPITAARSGSLVASVGRSHASVSVSAYGGDAESTKVFAYTDRPVYRPGDTVEYKGIARIQTRSGYDLVSAGTASTEIRNPMGDVIYRAAHPISDLGSFAGSFTFSPEAPPGYYDLIHTVNGQQQYSGIEVVAYRKPEFAVTVTPTQRYFIIGDQAEFDVEVRYYFGAPVQNAEVTCWVSIQDNYADDGTNAFTDVPSDTYRGDLRSTQTVRTDRNGRARLKVSTRGLQPSTYSGSLICTVDAYAQAPSGATFDGSGAVALLSSDVRLALNIDDNIVSPGSEYQVRVRATDPDTGTPIAGQQVRLTQQVRDAYDGDAKPNPVQQAVTTGADGWAAAVFRAPQEGYVVVEAAGTDRQRRTTTVSRSLWLFGSGPSAGRLTVVLDRNQYQIGNQAIAMIQTSGASQAVLVTAEAEGVVWHQVVRADKASSTIRFPITEDLFPNATLVATMVHEGRLATAEATIQLETESRRLSVEVSSDRERYEPGDKAEFTITARLSNGQPATNADFSLAIVDEAIFAIRRDNADIFSFFYPRRWSQVYTAYSFPEVYYDGGDKGSADIPVRSNFKDTAAWYPNLRTDADGRATVSVTLPDNLTTWRATAIGITAITDVGKAIHKVEVSKPLMVQMEGPRYLVSGDRQRLRATLHNATDQDLDVQTSLEVMGVTVAGQLERRLRLPRNSSANIDWDMTAANPGEAVLIAKVWTQDRRLTDGVERRITVQPDLLVLHATASATVTDRAAPKLDLPSIADPNFGMVRVTVSATVAGSLLAALPQLIQYPYGCVEQTTSRFLPLIELEHLFRQYGMRLDVDPKLNARTVAVDALNRLMTMQNGAGGWGWWEYGAPDPFMTAYVLDAMATARDLGYPVSPSSIDRAVEWAVRVSESAELDRTPVDDRLYLLYAVSRHGRGPWALEMARRLPKPTDIGGMSALVLLEHAYGNQLNPEQLVSMLTNSLQITPNTATWPENSRFGADGAGRGLLALMTISPNNELAPKVVRGLMDARRGYGWGNTCATAFAIQGLTRYLASTGELRGSAVATVSLGGREILRADLSAMNDTTRNASATVPLSEFLSAEGRLEVQKESGERVYVDVIADYGVPPRDLRNAPGTLAASIDRRYHLRREELLRSGEFGMVKDQSASTEFRSGDVLYCTITVESPSSHRFMMIEVPTPSGFTVIERDEPMYANEWLYWDYRMTIFDNRVVIFLDHIPEGKRQLNFKLRAETPGTTQALPAVISNMYDPGVFRAADATRLTIR